MSRERKKGTEAGVETRERVGGEGVRQRERLSRVERTVGMTVRREVLRRGVVKMREQRVRLVGGAVAGGPSFRTKRKRGVLQRQGRGGLGVEPVRKERVGRKTVVKSLILTRRTKSVQMHVFNSRKYVILMSPCAFYIETARQSVPDIYI